MRAIADMADIHYVRQGDPRGLGHAVGVAHKHVGDHPFAVMLGDDIMHERSGVLSDMLGRLRAPRARARSSPCARCPKAEISAYGCAARRATRTASSCACATSSRSRPPEEAPSNLAVMGRYVFAPEIFDAIATTEPGKGVTRSS